MFLVRWEGEAPPDKAEWLAAVRQALADEVGIYRVRFHREASGWHFDLECRSEAGSEQPTVTRASESVALNVYALLAKSGKPLDPDWDPLAPPGEVIVPPPPAGPATTTAAPAPQDADAVEDASLDRRATLEPATHSEPLGAEVPATPRRRPWPALRIASVRLAILGLALAAGWLTWDRMRRSPPSQPATPSAEALSAQERLKQLEAVVAQLQKEKAEGASPAPLAAPPPLRPGAAAGPGSPRAAPVATVAPRARATPTPSVPGPPPALETAPPPTTAPATPPTTTPAPPPAAPPPDPEAPSPDPEAAAPVPVERGTLVDLADPGVTRPVVVAQGQPRYPPLALQRGIEGTVVVSVLVDETGAVAEASVARASPRGMGFEDAATRYVKSRRYQAATKGGVPVRVRIEVVVEFRKPGSR